jgi:hypothetical protein
MERAVITVGQTARMSNNDSWKNIIYALNKSLFHVLAAKVFKTIVSFNSCTFKQILTSHASLFSHIFAHPPHSAGLKLPVLDCSYFILYYKQCSRNIFIVKWMEINANT